MMNPKPLDLERMAEKCEHVARTLKIVSHPQRFMILGFLADGEKTVSEIQEFCGISQSHVSQFLNRMKLEHLVNCRREGTSVYYYIVDDKIVELLKSLQRIFCH